MDGPGAPAHRPAFDQSTPLGDGLLSWQDNSFRDVGFDSGDKLFSLSGGGDAGGPSYFNNAEDRGGTDVGTGKVSKTIEQAAYWLDRTYATWNAFDARAGVAHEDNRWDDPFWGGATTVVTFAFRSTAPASMPDDTGGFSRFNTAQINATLLALASWSDVANIVFVRVGTGTDGEDAYSNNATMLYSNYATGSAGAAAFAYGPSSTAPSSVGGDVWVNSSLSYNANPVLGNYGTLTLVHETGHAIGFSHPGSYDAGKGSSITYAANAEYYEDSHQYTVMSYFTEDKTGAYFGPAYPATVMLDDIACAQRSYGVNTTTRTGDTVYGFNSNADRPWFVATSATSLLVFAVWDAGGNDTFDFSGFSNDQIINLNQGAFSSVGTYNGISLRGNVAIAKGAVIENAIGGAGADVITGNSSANRLTGNAGGDSLTGGGGADVFVATAGGGTDIITDFVVGTDRIDLTAFGAYQSIVQSGADTVVTFVPGVTMTLRSVTATTVTDASFIGLTGGSPPAGYNLINGTSGDDSLSGTAASDQIYGGDGADIISGLDQRDWLDGGAGNDTLNGGLGDDFLFGGTGNDSLDGGAGADAMTGGAGDDTYVVDNAGDTTVETAGGGTDTVLTLLAAYTLGAEVENLTGTGSSQTLTGNSLNNVISTGAGANTVLGGGGDDIFRLSTVSSGLPDSTYDGEGGFDTFDYSVAGSFLSFMSDQAAPNTFTVADNRVSGVEKVIGGSAGDVLSFVYFTVGMEAWGGGGSDQFWGGQGADRFFGEAGDDSFNSVNPGDSADGGLGDDNFFVSGGFGIPPIAGAIIGGSGTDLLKLNIAFSVDLQAGTAVSGAASYAVSSIESVMAAAISGYQTTVLGSDAAETFSVNPLFDDGSIGVIFDGRGGADNLSGGAGADTLSGGDGNDSLNGGLGNDFLSGGTGNDSLDGGAGADAMTGGAGDDTYVVDNAGDTTVETAGGGTDTVLTALAAYTLGAEVENLTGTGSGQTLSGNSLANNIQGGAGADTLSGGDGNDVLAGNGGADTMIGGLGDDTYVVSDASDTVVETPGGGTDTVQTSLAVYTLAAEVENLTGTGSGQTLSGNSLNNIIQGGTGADSLNGGAGADLLYGGEGADRLDAGAGVAGQFQYLFGQGGDDTYVYGAQSGLVFIGATAESAATGAADRVVFTDLNVGNVTLGYRDYTGSDPAEGLALMIMWENGQGSGQLRIANGGHHIEAFQFADGAVFNTLQLASPAGGTYVSTATGASADFILGGAGTDLLYGGEGADRLDAGAGVAGQFQYLFGQGGDDTYVYGTQSGLVFIGATAENAATGAADRVVFTDLNVGDVTLGYRDYTGSDPTEGLALMIMWENGQGSGQLRIANGGHHIEAFQFADGTVLTIEQLTTLKGGSHSSTEPGASAPAIESAGFMLANGDVVQSTDWIKHGEAPIQPGLEDLLGLSGPDHHQVLFPPDLAETLYQNKLPSHLDWNSDLIELTPQGNDWLL